MNTTTHSAIRPPGRHLMALEAIAAPWEHASTLAWWPLLRMAPRGDGHPVLVIPGLGASDSSTLLLRQYLSQQGHATYAWQLGANLGPQGGKLRALRQRIVDLDAQHGRTVSLIGWSLGGIYARELAKMQPHHVRSVITLGTGFTGNLNATSVNRFYEFVSGEKFGPTPFHHHLSVNPEAPTTSIWSRTDGVVAWECSVLEEGPRAENIEVRASHIGMGGNPSVLFAIADRLAQPEGRWKAFDKSGLRRLAYR
jgi:hypothetical protein